MGERKTKQQQKEKQYMNTMKPWLAVLATAFAITATSLFAQAAKAQPNPFAGTWCGPLLESTPVPPLSFVSNLVISDGGRISGGWEGILSKASYSGRVSNDGIMKLTISGTWQTWSFPSGRGSRQGSSNRVRLEITALVTLDDQGNLVGIGEAEGYEPFAFVWSRCGTP
jgi:hypothetical protein